ncbi:MAG: hypothetical protein M1828_000759 [Chrysothrix sp. TS-e1954]|nr:MAG: hypothetical protein M1828_000759 [Chrysothrix sp. TS-e1954]
MAGTRLCLIAAITLICAFLTNALPTVLHPVPHEFVVTQNNTINSTSVHRGKSDVAAKAPSTPLPLTFVHNLAGSSKVNAYVTGTDGDGAAFFLQADGIPYYPTNPAAGIPPTTITQNIAIPLNVEGQSVTIGLPNYITSGRIYFSAGTLTFATNYGPSGAVIVAPSFTNSADPNADANYGFVEFTWTAEAGIYSNLSYVDFIGLVISQMLDTASNGQCVVKGLPANAVNTVCDALKEQAKADGQAWDKSCQTDSSGTPIRVLAPLHLAEVDQSALSTYFDAYVNQVWSHYTSNKLIITAGDNGNFTGQVDSTGSLVFDQGGSFQKPVLGDIMGCNSGPFANPIGGDIARLSIVPRLCAAFDRSTLLLEGGNVQPDGVSVESYYSVSPTNHYSRIVHQNEVDGKGYAFAYDDVHPSSSPDVSGLCNDPNPVGLTFYVGGAPA